mmetsp:Transcript_11138/g.34314  ORF Transcript_11138/g.34314 Transcript_11138/m.34314 type:complete len:249 (-) Transcript_11138:31-777(-)
MSTKGTKAKRSVVPDVPSSKLTWVEVAPKTRDRTSAHAHGSVPGQASSGASSAGRTSRGKSSSRNLCCCWRAGSASSGPKLSSSAPRFSRGSPISSTFGSNVPYSTQNGSSGVKIASCSCRANLISHVSAAGAFLREAGRSRVSTRQRSSGTASSTSPAAKGCAAMRPRTPCLSLASATFPGFWSGTFEASKIANFRPSMIAASSAVAAAARRRRSLRISVGLRLQELAVHRIRRYHSTKMQLSGPIV